MTKAIWKILLSKTVVSFSLFSLGIILMGIVITIGFGDYRIGDMLYVIGNYIATIILLPTIIRHGELRKTKLGRMILLLGCLDLFILVFCVEFEGHFRLADIIGYTLFLLYSIQVILRNRFTAIAILKLCWALIAFILIPLSRNQDELKLSFVLFSTLVLTATTILIYKKKIENNFC